MKNGKSWYYILAYKAHEGTGSQVPQPVFIYDSNISRVFNKFKKIPGIRRGLNNRKFPPTKKLTREQGLVLEEEISAEKRITLNRAKRTFYLSGEDLVSKLQINQ